jgi:hypothetical protein
LRGLPAPRAPAQRLIQQHSIFRRLKVECDRVEGPLPVTLKSMQESYKVLKSVDVEENRRNFDIYFFGDLRLDLNLLAFSRIGRPRRVSRHRWLAH